MAYVKVLDGGARFDREVELQDIPVRRDPPGRRWNNAARGGFPPLQLARWFTSRDGDAGSPPIRGSLDAFRGARARLSLTPRTAAPARQREVLHLVFLRSDDRTRPQASSACDDGLGATAHERGKGTAARAAAAERTDETGRRPGTSRDGSRLLRGGCGEARRRRCSQEFCGRRMAVAPPALQLVPSACARRRGGCVYGRDSSGYRRRWGRLDPRRRSAEGDGVIVLDSARRMNLLTLVRPRDPETAVPSLSLSSVTLPETSRATAPGETR